MKRITTMTARIIATAALRQSWTILSAATRIQSQGERLEAWANRVAVRRGFVDDILHTVTADILSSH